MNKIANFAFAGAAGLVLAGMATVGILQALAPEPDPAAVARQGKIEAAKDKIGDVVEERLGPVAGQMARDAAEGLQEKYGDKAAALAEKAAELKDKVTQRPERGMTEAERQAFRPPMKPMHEMTDAEAAKYAIQRTMYYKEGWQQGSGHAALVDTVFPPSRPYSAPAGDVGKLSIGLGKTRSEGKILPLETVATSIEPRGLLSPNLIHVPPLAVHSVTAVVSGWVHVAEEGTYTISVQDLWGERGGEAAKLSEMTLTLGDAVVATTGRFHLLAFGGRGEGVDRNRQMRRPTFRVSLQRGDYHLRLWLQVPYEHNLMQQAGPLHITPFLRDENGKAPMLVLDLRPQGYRLEIEGTNEQTVPMTPDRYADMGDYRPPRIINTARNYSCSMRGCRGDLLSEGWDGENNAPLQPKFELDPAVVKPAPAITFTPGATSAPRRTAEAPPPPPKAAMEPLFPLAPK